MDRSSSPSPLYDGGSRPTGRPTFQPSSPSPLFQSSHASSSRAGPSSARQPLAARRPHQPSDPLSSPLQATSQAQRRPSARSASQHVTLGGGGMRSSPTAGPSRSGPSSPSPRSSGPPSGSQAPPPPTVVDVLWRERFKARCSDRVKRERARAVRHERERRGVVWESSEGDSGMDLDDDGGEDGGEDEEVEKEIFRRIINSQLRRQAREQARGADHALGSLDALLEDEELMAAASASTDYPAEDDMMDEDVPSEEADIQNGYLPSGGAQDDDAALIAAFDEIDDESLEAAYLEALMAAEASSASSADVAPIPTPILSPPICPFCWRSKPTPSQAPEYFSRLWPMPDGGLKCNSCRFTLGPQGSRALARSWENAPHGGSAAPKDHVPHFTAHPDSVPDQPPILLGLSCTGPGCSWAPVLTDEYFAPGGGFSR